MATPSKGFIAGTQSLAPTAPILTKQLSGGGIGQAHASGGAQVARSLGALGGALANMGQEGVNIALDLQKQKNFTERTEIRNGWDDALAQHEAAMMTVQDPDDRVTQTNEFLNKLKADTAKRDYMPRDLKMMVDVDMARFYTHTSTRTVLHAAALRQEQTIGMLGVSLDKEYENGTREGSHKKIDEAVASGVLPQWKGEEAKLRVDQRFDAKDEKANYGIRMAELTTHPRGTLKQIEEKTGDFSEENMDDWERIKWKNEALKSKGNLESQQVKGISDRLYTGDIPSYEALEDELSVNNEISEPIKKEILTKYKKAQPASHEDKIRWRTELDELRRVKSEGSADPSEIYNRYNKLHAEIYTTKATDGDSKAYKGSLAKLSPYVDHEPTDNKSEKARKKILVDYVSDTVDDFKKSSGLGTYHNTPSEKKDSVTGTKNNPATLANRKRDNFAADKAAHEIKVKVELWMQMRPNAKEEDIIRYANSLMEKDQPYLRRES